MSLAESNEEKNELHCTNSANWRAAKQNLSIKNIKFYSLERCVLNVSDQKFLNDTIHTFVQFFLLAITGELTLSRPPFC